MEDKQLDFNAPLLSVRRFSASSSDGHNSNKIENSQGSKPYVPPYYKSELKSGPMRHAGTVPFFWEQIPGKRKDGDEGSGDRSIERPLVAPRLPPGRILDVKSQHSDKEFQERTIVKPQNDVGHISRQKFLPINANVSNIESTKEGKKEKRESDSEDGDEVYADALETLSRSESFFFNCSVSGISGMEGMNFDRSETSSTDPQTRDYMMDRFLPAAKAMASEAPQHAPWKQPATRELPIVVKKTAGGDKRPPLYQYKSYVVPQYVEETVEEESEDDDDDYRDSGNPSSKACGFFPKFCLKNSLFLLNPIPGMKVRSRAPYPSARKISSHLKTTYSASNDDTDDLSNWEAVYKHKLMSDLQPLDDESKGTSESNQLTYWSDSQTPDGSSPHVHSGGGGISPFRSDTIQSPFHEGTGFLGIPKHVKSVKTNTNNSFLHEDGKWQPDSPSPLVEKTLCVDSEHLQKGNPNFSFSDTHQMIAWKEDSETLNRCQGIDASGLAVSCPGYINDLTTSQEKGMLKPKISEAVGSNLWTSSERSNPSGQPDGMNFSEKDDVLNPGTRSLMPSEFSTRGSLEFNKTEPWKEEEKCYPNEYSLQLPLPPPLPKSPSESWLWRTLPSISSKNGTSFHPRKQSPKRASINPKWETIVKTSNAHHSHLRFSEELTAPVPQQSET